MEKNKNINSTKSMYNGEANHCEDEFIPQRISKIVDKDGCYLVVYNNKLLKINKANFVFDLFDIYKDIINDTRSDISNTINTFADQQNFDDGSDEGGFMVQFRFNFLEPYLFYLIKLDEYKKHGT